jgi:orotidine-5'-phosphate decarboxylase
MPAELIVALDVPTLAEAEAAARRLPPAVLVKIGLELFTVEGPEAVRAFVRQGRRVFLDLKFHDIPRTVAHAVRSASRLGASLMTVHAAGGRAMLKAAAEAAAEAGGQAPRLIAVTTLTSLNADDFADLGVGRTLPDQALALADLALGSGIDGVVASVHEAAVLRRRFGPRPLLVTPGIRPSGAEVGDQKRVATPAAAVRAGASHLVVGRPILEAPDPAVAAAAILAEIAGAAG